MIALFAAAAVAAAAPCVLPAGWSSVAARGSPFVVFGEDHGTGQAPALVGQVVCGLLARHEHVLVALEQEAEDDAALGAAFSLSEESDARLALPRVLHWAGRQDGRESRAMLALLLRLYRLKRAGNSVEIVAFDGPRDRDQEERWRALPGQGSHEAEQAENIRFAAARGRYDHVVVLVGNLHASKRQVERGGATFEPMAMRLAPAAAVTSLDMAWTSGTAWDCRSRPGWRPQPGQPIPADAVDCGPHASRGLPDLRRAPFVALGRLAGAPASDLAFDGYFWVGPITASPPALAAP